MQEFKILLQQDEEEFVPYRHVHSDLHPNSKVPDKNEINKNDLFV